VLEESYVTYMSAWLFYDDVWTADTM